MNFCPNCEFMVYTKREEGSLTLTNYCKTNKSNFITIYTRSCFNIGQYIFHASNHNYLHNKSLMNEQKRVYHRETSNPLLNYLWM